MALTSRLIAPAVSSCARSTGRLTRASSAANPAIRPGWKNERRVVLEIERRLITHGQPIKHITRWRRGSVSVGAFTDLAGEIGPQTAGCEGRAEGEIICHPLG